MVAYLDPDQLRTFIAIVESGSFTRAADIVAKTGRNRDQASRALMGGNPQQRFIQPDEIARTVLWLTSDAARSVNGQALAISEGEQ